jgi:transglutaminase-like putative cysteine protease
MIVFGFIILGLLKLERLKDSEAIFINKKLWLKWLVPLTIITLVTTSVGYFAPKAAPQWPDPIPYLKGYGEGGGGSGVKRVGYGTNDSNLGGAFIGDETLVFRVEATDREYWRVETKDIYTGKGWEASDSNVITEEEESAVTIPMIEPSVETILKTANVDVQLGYPHVAYPVELNGVQTGMEILYHINTSTEKIMTERSGQPFPLERYTVTYNDPKYIMEDLRASSSEDPEGFARYKQLPNELPDRVRTLAEEIVAPYSNRYDQVKAVESYFRANGYKYETIEVAVPGKNDDYVDQFLFETMQGYCDNFSTSMVVLLRSVGIPARWVKGYTGGDYIETTPENTRIYEVKNANAHSWVEVYFPGIGWVPFEPTAGFTNPYNFETNRQQDDATIPVPDLNEEQPETPEEDLLAEEDQGNESTAGKSWSIDITFADVVKLIAVLILLAGILYFTRRRWLPIYILRRYGNFTNSRSFEKAYFILIRSLKSYGLKRKDTQTLREFAAYVDSFFYTKDMRKLTRKLEGIQYRKGSTLDDRELKALRELWENLIKRVAS